MKPDRIIYEASVLGGYSKWKDRSIDKKGIEHYNLLMSAAELRRNNQPVLLNKSSNYTGHMYTVTLLCTSAWKVK